MTTEEENLLFPVQYVSVHDHLTKFHESYNKTDKSDYRENIKDRL